MVIRVILLLSVTTRRNGVHVYLNDQAKQGKTGFLCGYVTGEADGSDIPDVVSIPCHHSDQYVTVYQETNNGDYTVLDFIEVEAYGKIIIQLNFLFKHCLVLPCVTSLICVPASIVIIILMVFSLDNSSIALSLGLLSFCYMNDLISIL